MGKVVDKFVMQLEAQLADRDVIIELSDDARQWLARKGYDKLMGARPLGRIIQESIKKPLAEELLFGSLTKGGLVRVGIKDNKPVFDIDPAKGGGKGGSSGPSGDGGGGVDGGTGKTPELAE